MLDASTNRSEGADTIIPAGMCSNPTAATPAAEQDAAPVATPAIEEPAPKAPAE